MRPAGTFATILAVGVLIVLIYQWSGDSIIVLIMCLVTLFALLALWDRKPWAVDQNADEWPDSGRQKADSGHPDVDRYDDAEQNRQEAAVEEGDQDQHPETVHSPEPEPISDDSPLWRCRFDVRLNEEGVTGLALGQSEPQLWPWEAITSAKAGWSKAIADGENIEERVGLHLLYVTPEQDGVEPSELAQLMFGAEQRPDVVVYAIEQGITTARIRRSRFHDLSPAERTRQLAKALSPNQINLTKNVRSPELLYQEARRALLANRTLRRISRDANAEQVLVAFEQLLAAHQADELTETELGPLGAAADNGDIASVYKIGGRIAQDRGYRLAFVHHGGEDHLLGLLVMDDAPDWDGQTIGSGLNTVSLAPPTFS